MTGGTAPPSLASRPDRGCVHGTSRVPLGTVSKKPPQACQQLGPRAADACLLGVCVTIFVSRKTLSAGSRKGAACSALRERDRDGDQGTSPEGQPRGGAKGQQSFLGSGNSDGAPPPPTPARLTNSPVAPSVPISTWEPLPRQGSLQHGSVGGPRPGTQSLLP